MVLPVEHWVVHLSKRKTVPIFGRTEVLAAGVFSLAFPIPGACRTPKTAAPSEPHPSCHGGGTTQTPGCLRTDRRPAREPPIRQVRATMEGRFCKRALPNGSLDAPGFWGRHFLTRYVDSRFEKRASRLDASACARCDRRCLDGLGQSGPWYFGRYDAASGGCLSAVHPGDRRGHDAAVSPVDAADVGRDRRVGFVGNHCVGRSRQGSGDRSSLGDVQPVYRAHAWRRAGRLAAAASADGQCRCRGRWAVWR